MSEPGSDPPGEATARQQRQQRRRERSRDEILQAARRVIVRDGLGSITLDAVAAEVGLTKGALYYYFPSKDALLRELMYDAFLKNSQALHDAVAPTRTGPEALRAIIRETIEGHAPRMDDFRLAYLHPQVAPPAVAHASAGDLERIRPLNDLAYGGAAERLRDGPPGRAGVDPRLMAFLANLAALGVLTMKGMVERVDDPLKYSDAELVDALARIFEAAAAP